MYRPRIIPVLLLRNNALVKSVKFKNHIYIGDPLNAVHLFNHLQADELILLDIAATREKRFINKELVKTIGEEARMPFSVGGGIGKLKDIECLLNAGAERVILNSYAATQIDFLKNASLEFGATTLIVCMDVKKNLMGKNKVCIFNGKKLLPISPAEYALMVEENGAGEIIIQSVQNDGCMNGYDISLIKEVTDEINIPVTILGGAGSLADMQVASKKTGVNGLAAGSIFIYQGIRKGVLINYPDKSTINTMEWN